MTVITLTTDFGSADYEVGVLRGVIWRISPTVKITDLSNDITPYDVAEASLVLWRSCPFFPNGTIHLTVVDPGVGTSRRGIAAQIGSQFFVGPDNGFTSMVQEKAETNRETIEFVHLDQPQYWLPDISSVFHGRDIFAPVAAHLANGILLTELGKPITDAVRLSDLKPYQTSTGWRGQVIQIDHFGNISTNLSSAHIPRTREVIIDLKGNKIVGLVSTFGDRPVGTLVALLDSSGLLTISIVNGNAARLTLTSVGDEIDITNQG